MVYVSMMLLHIYSLFPKEKKHGWCVCVCPGSTAEGAYFARVREGQPAGHAGQTDLLVHLQTAKLGRPNPSLLPQRDWRGSHEQVSRCTTHMQTDWLVHVLGYTHILHALSHCRQSLFHIQTHTHTLLNILHVSGLCRHTVSHVAKLFKENGSDCWWELPIETLLPAEVLKKVSILNVC